MVGAMGYLVGGVIFAAVAAFISSQQVASDPEVPTYGYGRSWVWCFIALGMGILLTSFWLEAGFAIGDAGGILVYVIGWIALLWVAAVYAYCLIYRITATEDALVVRGLITTRSIPYSDIRECGPQRWGCS